MNGGTEPDLSRDPLEQAVDQVRAAVTDDAPDAVPARPVVDRAKTIAGRAPGVGTPERQDMQARLNEVRGGRVTARAFSALTDVLRALGRSDLTPTLERDPLVLPVMDAPQVAMWHTLMDLDEVGVPWVLVGGQMVTLHCLEAGARRSRATRDGDIVVDVWVDRGGLRKITRTLRAVGFEESAAGEISGEGFRYLRGETQVDVMVPEGTDRQRVRPTTVTGRLGTEVPGANRALTRAERLPITVDGRTGWVRRPTLLGALVAKTRASLADPAAERHRADLMDLLAVAAAGNLYAVVDQAAPVDRRWFRRRFPQVDPRWPDGVQVLVEELIR